MFHITSRDYESCFACRTLISNWIDRCFGQHLWNRVHSLSRDNRRIPTNPLSGNQQPLLLWGQWIRSQILLEINAGIATMLDSNWSYFPAPPYVNGFFADGIIRCLLYDDFLRPHIPHACLWRIYMRVCKKMVVFVYLGIKRKYTWQKTHVYRVAGMIASIRGKKTAGISCHILKQKAENRIWHLLWIFEWIEI